MRAKKRVFFRPNDSKIQIRCIPTTFMYTRRYRCRDLLNGNNRHRRRLVSEKLRVRKTNKSSWNVDTAGHIIIERVGMRDQTSLLLLAIWSMFTIIFVTDVWAAAHNSRMKCSPLSSPLVFAYARGISPKSIHGFPVKRITANEYTGLHARTPLNVPTVMRCRTVGGRCRWPNRGFDRCWLSEIKFGCIV